MMMDKFNMVDGDGLPDKGTGTGLTDAYGADVSQDATNSMAIKSADTISDEAMDNSPEGPNLHSTESPD